MAAHTKGTFHCKCVIINCFSYIANMWRSKLCRINIGMYVRKVKHIRCLWVLALPFGMKRSQQKKLIPIYDVIKSVFICKKIFIFILVRLSLGENQCRKKSIKLKPFVACEILLCIDWVICTSFQMGTLISEWKILSPLWGWLPSYFPQLCNDKAGNFIKNLLSFSW